MIAQLIRIFDPLLLIVVALVFNVMLVSALLQKPAPAADHPALAQTAATAQYF